MADRGTHRTGNIFPETTVDRGGNLYYTWSEDTAATGEGGEQGIYYAYSTDGGEHWSQAIPLTQEKGDSAVFPWMARDPDRHVSRPLPPTPCGLTMTVSLSSLGITPGSSLSSITGGSFYYFAIQEPVPATRVPLGFSNQADVTPALDDNGTGTTK